MRVMIYDAVTGDEICVLSIQDHYIHFAQQTGRVIIPVREPLDMGSYDPFPTAPIGFRTLCLRLDRAGYVTTYQRDLVEELGERNETV